VWRQIHVQPTAHSARHGGRQLTPVCDGAQAQEASMSLQHRSVSIRVNALYVILLMSAAGMLAGSFISETVFTRVVASRGPIPPVSIISLGTPITQNFDTLATSGTANAWVDDSTLLGWYSQFSLQPANPTTYRADTGTGTTGAIYSYGTAANTDRAFGSLCSGTSGDIFTALKLVNNTGSTITSLNISYTGEQWRNGNANAQQLDFQYQVATAGTITDANTPSTGWIDFDPLDFASPIAGATSGSLDGNAAPNRTARSATLAATINNGREVWLRWKDTNDTGNDHGLAIDDFSVTAFAPPNLTINDVSLNEGDSGTTAFTFMVSLSSAAGPAGVTFDIGTQNNSAIAPTDYTTKTLTGQVIPSGGTSATFTIFVIGDTSPESNETFFVNVTNVTGANVADGTAVGTIQNDDSGPNLTINDVTLNEGNGGTTAYTFTVSLSSPAGTGGVIFDIATADNSAQDDNPVTEDNDYVSKNLTSQMISEGNTTYTFDVLINGDRTFEGDETFFVNVTNITNAVPIDSQGIGTIVNDDLYKIHDIQGSGAATPIPGTTVTIEGVVVGSYNGNNKLQGFFLQEEDADADSSPATSEGIFVFCGSCSTPVVEGQTVMITGTVSEFNNMTEITASVAGSVVVTNAGNRLSEVTTTALDLPVVGDINAFYEAREGMLVTFVDQLTVSDCSELARFGQIELFEGPRPRQFTETSPPNAAGYAAHLEDLARRQVILDDDNNTQNSPLALSDGSQYVFHPRENGGFSIGTQGPDFFRGGDLVNNLTGVLHWSFPGFGPSTWRIRPTATTPATFTVANPRPAAPPSVGGAIKAVSMNMLNYFSSIDTTASSSSGPCGPSGTQDCRGADSIAERIRQRERASIVICGLNADVYALMELENTTPTDTINDLLGAVNARCGGGHPYAFVNTGGTLGTDAIRVMIIYRTGVLQPVGSPLVDHDPIHNRPPTAQTFDVVDPANPAFGQRFTLVANHFKSKGCDASATGADADAGDGQSCYNGRRTSQATRLLTWLNSTVLPAAGDPDVLLLGDFNSYAKEDPVTTLTAAGFVDLASSILGPTSYSYLFDAQLGHLDYAFTSSSLASRITGIGNWHINADESDLFDYNDEIKDTGEPTFDEKPDGSALVPPRVVFQPGSPYRASDHDPVIVGLFQFSDLAVTKDGAPDPVMAGNNLTYTINLVNNGPSDSQMVTITDAVPANTTFVSATSPTGWTSATPAPGGTGNITFSKATVASSETAVFIVMLNVNANTGNGATITNSAVAASSTSDSSSPNNTATTATTVQMMADLVLSKTDSPDPVTPGMNLTYAITVRNNGPSDAQNVSLTDAIPSNTTFVSEMQNSGPAFTCMNPPAGGTGSTSCTIGTLAAGASATFQIVVNVNSNTANGTTITNSAIGATTTADSNSANNTGTSTTTVGASADIAVTKSDSPDPVSAGSNLTYTISFVNNGPSTAQNLTVTDAVPANTTFISAALTTGTGWGVSTPAVGGTGNVVFSKSSVASGETAVFTMVVKVGAATTINNSAVGATTTSDPTPGNNTGTSTTTVTAQADLAVTKTDSPDPISVGNNVTYTINFVNNGPSSAQNVTVTDAVPVNTTFVSATAPAGWTISTPAVGGTGNVQFSRATVLSGETAVFTIVVKVNANTPNNTLINNSATAASTTADGTPGNNTGTASTTVVGQADLAVTKTDSPDPACVNGNITYTITLTNNGPGAAASTTVTDGTPANTTFVSASVTSGAGWTMTSPAVGGTGNVVFSKASTANGETATFQVVVKVNAGTLHGTVINNSATAASSIPDPNTGNNTGTAATTVDPIAPTFTNSCPGGISTASPATCPFSSAGAVTFATPAATDNCGGVTVACVPPSGSMFPTGTTSVTCTATDTAGNTATCTFPVTVFNLCVQDNSNPGNVVLIDTSTGAYRFCCNGVLVASGTGMRYARGCTLTISDSSNNRIVQISVDGAVMKGTASVKQGGNILCTIQDSNLGNNTCVCQ
jgi:uncharacterized repeat protein (TIGR01451 family)